MTLKTTAQLTVGDRVALYDGTKNYERRFVTVTSEPRESEYVTGFMTVDTDERPISGGAWDTFEVS